MIPCSAGELHRDLNARALAYAVKHGLLHELTPGRSPSVIFGVDAAGRHGNLYPASYRAVLADAGWRARLDKAHTASLRARPRADWRWRELDCAASSDALLMSVFCAPGVSAASRVAGLLGTDPGARPEFGVRELVERTEIDMALGDLLVEAKLTEAGFGMARPALLERYTGWREVFDEAALPRTGTGLGTGWIAQWQLVRGVLAARATGGRFCLLCDARRLDLIAAWQGVLGAVVSAGLRCRMRLLTWQDLAGVVPGPLRVFLREKYGIEGRA